MSVTIQLPGDFDEILSPVRQGFQQSGLNDEELDRLFEEARDEVWQKRQKDRS